MLRKNTNAQARNIETISIVSLLVPWFISSFTLFGLFHTADLLIDLVLLIGAGAFSFAVDALIILFVGKDAFCYR